jgi:hypothetical protein
LKKPAAAFATGNKAAREISKKVVINKANLVISHKEADKNQEAANRNSSKAPGGKANQVSGHKDLRHQNSNNSLNNSAGPKQVNPRKDNSNLATNPAMGVDHNKNNDHHSNGMISALRSLRNDFHKIWQTW